MKGSKCRCGFATTSTRTRCPRCGKEMKVSQWEEKGKVLSLVELRAAPQGMNGSFSMALVEIDDEGPKIICWTTDTLKDDDEVVVTESNGKYMCSAAAVPKEQGSKPD